MERAPTSFTVMASGALQSAELPGCGNAYCKLSFYHGDDWQLLDGFEDGITQITKADGASGTLIWNFPMEVVYRATNAFGWPQVALSVYSVDSLGRDIVKGYGAVHLPTTTGKHKLTVHLYKVRRVDVHTCIYTQSFHGHPSRHVFMLCTSCLGLDFNVLHLNDASKFMCVCK